MDFPFLFFDLLFGAARAASPEEREERKRERRKEEVRQALEQAAFALFGRYAKPWFRRPRAIGRIDGREVEVVWLGRGQVEVRAVARETLDLRIVRPGWLARTFTAALPTVAGSTTSLHADAQGLIGAGVDSLTIAHGHLVARARCRLDADRLVWLARRIMAVAWADGAAARPAPEVVVKGAPAASSSTAPPPPPADGADLRCPYCHDALGAVVVRCDACAAPHHPSCFEEGHGCSIAGCRHQKARGARVQA